MMVIYGMVRDTTVVFAQTPLLKSQLEELKRLSGTTCTKDALQASVNHYLNCTVIREREERERERERKKTGGGLRRRKRIDDMMKKSRGSLNNSLSRAELILGSDQPLYKVAALVEDPTLLRLTFFDQTFFKKN